MSASPPTGYRNVSAYLVVPDAEAVMEFAKSVFGAVEVEPPVRLENGRFMHVALEIGDSVIMMGTPVGEFTAQTAMLHVYVDDCDACHAKALAAGGVETMAPSDQIHGDRAACVSDVAGNLWWIASRREEVAPEEIARRAMESA